MGTFHMVFVLEGFVGFVFLQVVTLAEITFLDKVKCNSKKVFLVKADYKSQSDEKTITGIGEKIVQLRVDENSQPQIKLELK